MKLCDIQPYIRYVNNYMPMSSYTENERILYDFEFMYIMDGSVDMCYDGAHYNLQKYDLFLLRPGVKNYITVDEKSGFRTHCIHFDWIKQPAEYEFTVEDVYMKSIKTPDYENLLKNRPTPEPEDFYFPVCIRNAPALAPLFSACYYSYVLKTPASSVNIKADFLKIAAEICSICDSDESRLRHPKIIYAIEYIKAHYSEHITAPMLAKKYGLSPKYFGMLFKAATNKSVRDFTMEQRLFSAKEMLAGTNLSIEEISERTGFSNAFYFSKCFKDAEKISPSRYRALISK